MFTAVNIPEKYFQKKIQKKFRRKKKEKNQFDV